LAPSSALTCIYALHTGLIRYKFVALLPRSFSSRDTLPARGADGRKYRWPAVLQLADGHWAPDGCGFAMADVAGMRFFQC
jgi:hypothetical protein